MKASKHGRRYIIELDVNGRAICGTDHTIHFDNRLSDATALYNHDLKLRDQMNAYNDPLRKHIKYVKPKAYALKVCRGFCYASKSYQLNWMMQP